MKTMKQVQINSLPIRVKESEVDLKLLQDFVFCSKSEWKEKVRDINVSSVSEQLPDKKTKKTKTKK